MRASLSWPPGLAKPRGRRSLTTRSSRSAASTRPGASYQVSSIIGGNFGSVRPGPGSGARRKRSISSVPCGTLATRPEHADRLSFERRVESLVQHRAELPRAIGRAECQRAHPPAPAGTGRAPARRRRQRPGRRWRPLGQAEHGRAARERADRDAPHGWLPSKARAWPGADRPGQPAMRESAPRFRPRRACRP